MCEVQSLAVFPLGFCFDAMEKLVRCGGLTAFPLEDFFFCRTTGNVTSDFLKTISTPIYEHLIMLTPSEIQLIRATAL